MGTPHRQKRWTTLLGARYERVESNAGDIQGYSNSYAIDANAFNNRDHQRTDNNIDLTALARYTATPCPISSSA